MRHLLHHILAGISQQPRLQPVQMVECQACQHLAVSAGLALQAFESEAHVIDDMGADASSIVKATADHVGQVDDDLLDDREIGDQRGEGGFRLVHVAHGFSNPVFAAWRRDCLEAGRSPRPLACGPP